MSRASNADTRVAVVTGASSGIGAATARSLASAGYLVYCAARREDRIKVLADQIGGVAIRCDVGVTEDVQALAAAVGSRCDVLVNNAGGALGLEEVVDADLDNWRRMYDSNVLGAAAVTKALLPVMIAGHSYDDAATIMFVTSTASSAGYEKGAGYCAAKAGERALVQSLRLEVFSQPVKVCEIAPGMVHTDEFSLTRFGGDQARADAVYEGVPDPLTAEDVAECITWVATRPAHVNIDSMTVRPRAQAAHHKVHRITAQA